MARWNLIALAAVLGMTLSLPASAQWKWKDKSGHTQYSDLPPPPGISEQDILQRPAGGSRNSAPVALPGPAPSAPPLMAVRASDPVLEAKRKQAEQEVADKQKAEDAKVAAVRADNCSRAKEQMRAIDSGRIMARTNAKGEREFLDEAGRAAETKRTRVVMSSECK